MLNTNITELLVFSVQNSASDLHLSAGLPPILRVDGELQHLQMPELDQLNLLNLLYGIMTDKQCKEFEESLEIDFSFEIANLARFRVNIFNQNRGIAAVFRIIPTTIASLDDLEFPTLFKQLVKSPRGLVLITGATGSGKSTTMAAMLDYINNHSYRHIITIEDPIEFIHTSTKSLINQREVHRDTRGFHQALRAALREDPDVILVGEMRDAETIRLAITAAETGHLVFATLHTSSAAKSINRIMDVFAGNEKAVIRTMLAESLQAVISQTLVKKITGGRVAALEIMVCIAAIRNLIREDKIAQIYSVIQTNHNQGMQTLDQHLSKLVNGQIITAAVAKEVTGVTFV
ncbi:type IV pilus twitching motility protein PilT [soil metagenome]